MTEQEAIVELKHLTNRWANDEDMYSSTMKYDVDQELINAVYKAENALEKQIAKKPIDKLMYIECPACGDVGIEDCAYCPVCGQKLDWSEV